MKTSSFPSGVRYMFAISLFLLASLFVYGFFQNKNEPLVIHDHVLPEVPVK